MEISTVKIECEITYYLFLYRVKTYCDIFPPNAEENKYYAPSIHPKAIRQLHESSPEKKLIFHHHSRGLY